MKGEMKKDTKDTKKQNIENEMKREITDIRDKFNVSSPHGFKVLYISVL